MELRLDSTDGLADKLRSLPSVGAVEPTPEGLQVMVEASEGVVPSIVETALPAGLRDMSVTEPTLETVFISLTGRDLRE